MTLFMHYDVSLKRMSTINHDYSLFLKRDLQIEFERYIINSNFKVKQNIRLDFFFQVCFCACWNAHTLECIGVKLPSHSYEICTHSGSLKFTILPKVTNESTQPTLNCLMFRKEINVIIKKGIRGIKFGTFNHSCVTAHNWQN